MSCGVCETCGGEHALCRCPPSALTREQFEALRDTHRDCQGGIWCGHPTMHCLLDYIAAQDTALAEAAAREAALYALLPGFDAPQGISEAARSLLADAEKWRKVENEVGRLAHALSDEEEREELSQRAEAAEARVRELEQRIEGCERCDVVDMSTIERARKRGEGSPTTEGA